MRKPAEIEIVKVYEPDIEAMKKALDIVLRLPNETTEEKQE